MNECVLLVIQKLIIAETKSEKSEKIGPCVNGLCPANYECINNECIKTHISFANDTRGIEFPL